MKYKIGDVIFQGGGNGSFCTFAKCCITDTIEVGSNSYYIVKYIANYGSMWSREFDYENEHNCIESSAFDTFEDAKKRVYYEMRIKSDREFIKLYFERGK